MAATQTEPAVAPVLAGRQPPLWLIRSLRIWFCLFWLALLLGATGMLAVGGRPDPVGPRQVLDGPWRFHAGDDPAWANPATDDRSWDRLTLVSRPEINDGDVGIPGYMAGWRAHGHPRLSGYGWYRRQVIVPPQGDYVLVGPPAVDDGYEMFWNGRRIGGVGRLSGSPRVIAARPMIARLPASNGGQSGLLAIRAYMDPTFDRDGQSGGLRTVPVLAPRAQGEALYRAQWNRTIAGYIFEVVEPAGMVALAIIAFFTAPLLARPRFARWIALALIASACLRLGNAVAAWTDILSLPWLVRQNGIVLVPLCRLVWTITWNQWTDGRSSRPVSWAAMAGWLVLVVAAVTNNPLLAGAGRAVIALCLIAIAIRVVRHGEHKWLVLAAMLLTVAVLSPADLSTLGIPGIWFPFNIGVSRTQYVYVLALPLFAWALAASRHRATSRPAPES